MKENVFEMHHLVREQSRTEAEADPPAPLIWVKAGGDPWAPACPATRGQRPDRGFGHLMLINTGRHSRTRPAGPRSEFPETLITEHTVGGPSGRVSAVVWALLRAHHAAHVTSPVLRPAPEPHTAVLGLPWACPALTPTPHQVHAPGCQGAGRFQLLLGEWTCRTLWPGSEWDSQGQRTSMAVPLGQRKPPVRCSVAESVP